MNIEDVVQLIRSQMSSSLITLEQAAEWSKRFVQNDTLVKDAKQLIRREIGLIEDLRDPTAVRQRRFEPWYPGPKDDHVFWPPLKRYLLEEKGWDPETVGAIDKASSKVVGQLPFPGSPKFDGRGLVLGYVQSGKTANFTGVISKAADEGYRLIIVLSGLTNSLRRQTQERMETDLISLVPKRWLRWTTIEDDIGEIPISADALLSQQLARNLAIVKKNSYRLRRLINMLRGSSELVLANCPVLIIDDECDQASVNSARLERERTAINQLLVDLLDLLPKVAYVGYTATPYANVLIDPNQPEDLYPRDFIIDLPKPPAYFGAERLFGRRQLESDLDDEGTDDGLDMIREVPESEESELRPTRSEKDTWALPITESLQECLQYFVMAAAARRVRGDAEKPCALLIHTTHYAAAHLNSRRPVMQFIEGLGRSLVAGESSLLDTLREQWSDELEAVPASEFGRAAVGFDELLEVLPATISEMQYFVENGSSDQRLELFEGPAIVIGGNVLARGLTIEGLVCSFFVRTATLYDSLMQMGRWFGYRVNYEDLPRVWMPAAMASDFRDLATVEHEIRQDIARYSEDGTVTPEDLGVRVRLHPRMEVTARLKQRTARTIGRRSFDGRVLQTTRFRTKDEAWLEQNLEAGASLLHDSREAGGEPEFVNGAGHLFRSVPWQAVRRFLESYSIHSQHHEFSGDEIRDYVEQQLGYGQLGKWNVGVVVSGAKTARSHGPFGPLQDVPMVRRSAREDLDSHGKDIGVLLTRSHATIDFDIAFSGPKALWPDLKRARGPRTHDRERAVEEPLLLLYLVDRESAPRTSGDDGTGGDGNSKPRRSTRHELGAVRDVLGIGLVFPETDHPVTVEYVVAPVGAHAVEHFDDEIEDEELGLIDESREMSNGEKGE
tara:strand:+ start:2088 stop:4778 length:2691 start_codon:yes stop_codon:yes gene_type:complete